MTNKIAGNIIDIPNRRIFKGEITIENERIINIRAVENAPDHYILPGFIDAHIHIESSMLVPYEFAKIALAHGTVATISDPHEIANVLGIEGVYYMIENAKEAKLKFHFGAPSCVPATSFETAGATIDAEGVKTLLENDAIFYLSEMMNYPGVLFNDKEVMQKIAYAKAIGKPIDGHAPGLRGETAKTYISAGISTDHECFTLEEALDKLGFGMKILIREGSAAKNYEALHPLISQYADKLMFCSDDKHPDNLLVGHINELVTRSLINGYDLFDVLQMACINPIEHYDMKVGYLREGDLADFIVVNNLKEFKVLQTYINGEKVAENGQVFLEKKTHSIVNNFNIQPKQVSDFQYFGNGANIPIINALDGQLITEKSFADLPTSNGQILPDLQNDLLKICVVNRYREAPVAIGFIKNFNLKNGAIASTVGHDSHNIIAVGTSDEQICRAVNLLIAQKGGLSAVAEKEEKVIALPIAGLMSDLSCLEIGTAYAAIDAMVKTMGCTLHAPYMTLSFMALLVIPKIKMSDLGLFDAEKFEFLTKVG
jgi:adenine deaminase